MRLGIIGLPASGKTTIFNALTGADLPIGELMGGARVEVHTAVVDVPDERLEQLRQHFHPPKTSWAKVTFTDIGGLRADVGRDGLPGPLLNHLEQMDGYLHVIRSFEDPNVPHPSGNVDPGRDLDTMEDEFLLNDMLAVERRLKRLAEERQKGGRDRSVVDREITLFERLSSELATERPLRQVGLTAEEEKLLAGFSLLTRKPMQVVVNVAEGQEAPTMKTGEYDVQPIAFLGKLEMELAQLPPEEAQLFRHEFGLQETGRARIIRACYELLNLQSFFTMNEKELRAWTLPKGSTALDAAGTVHTDMARGFIRAEVIGWHELIQYPGLSKARAEGNIRIEGKEYSLKDGEVVTIRFNI